MMLIIATAALALTMSSAAYAPKCRAEGERCAGANGKPAVEWIKCCEGGCEKPHPEWGMICAKGYKAPVKEKTYAEELPKCREEGERCAGAYGKPAVEWIKCCEGGCEKPHTEWGMMCAKGYTTPVKEKKYAEEKPKCRAEGDRCMGSYGKPALEWIKCCEGGCVAPHPEWGMMCAKAFKDPAKDWEKKYVEESLKCRKTGERCAGAENKPAVPWIPCCDGGCHVMHPEWGMMCGEKCVVGGGACGEGHGKCCGKTECVKEAYGAKMKCVAKY